MKIGIIGTAGSGKTTLFNALTGLGVQTGGVRKTHLAAMRVPDTRLEAIARIAHCEKTVPVEIFFSDVAGGVGSKPSREHGMDPKLLNLMSAEEAFALVIADFEGYVHPGGVVSGALSGARELEGDLMLADLVVVEGKLERIVREHNQGIEQDTLEKCRHHLEKELPLRTLNLSRDETKTISSYGFLSQKKGILIRNIGEEKIGKPEPEGIKDFVRERGLRYIPVAAKLQMEIAQMDTQERAEYAQAMGLEGFALDTFIQEAFRALDLITFFSIGGHPKEVHAWTTTRGSPAIEAAGRIHSDMQRGFIRAEVVHYDDYVSYGGETEAKQAGKARSEGKEYIVQDGDIILFRFNV